MTFGTTPTLPTGLVGTILYSDATTATPSHRAGHMTEHYTEDYCLVRAHYFETRHYRVGREEDAREALTWYRCAELARANAGTIEAITAYKMKAFAEAPAYHPIAPSEALFNPELRTRPSEDNSAFPSAYLPCAVGVLFVRALDNGNVSLLFVETITIHSTRYRMVHGTYERTNSGDYFSHFLSDGDPQLSGKARDTLSSTCEPVIRAWYTAEIRAQAEAATIALRLRNARASLQALQRFAADMEQWISLMEQWSTASGFLNSTDLARLKQLELLEVKAFFRK